MLCITHVKFKKCSSPNKIFELYKRYAKEVTPDGGGSAKIFLAGQPLF